MQREVLPRLQHEAGGQGRHRDGGGRGRVRPLPLQVLPRPGLQRALLLLLLLGGRGQPQPRLLHPQAGHQGGVAAGAAVVRRHAPRAAGVRGARAGGLHGPGGGAGTAGEFSAVQCA